MNPSTAQRFPLIARPRPSCVPLAQRVAGLRERAGQARDGEGVAEATAVFNLAALLASDCGLPDLARSWCRRLAEAALGNALDPRHCLEPIVNLARLHVRAGDGATAWAILEGLFQAIDTRTDTVIDGLIIPTARITGTAEAHASARSWLWTVLLGTGAHALASAGRWDEASRRLSAYNGVGNRMLDGRQVTVIAHALAGRHQEARSLVDETRPGEPWENAVTACLALLVTTDGPADTTSAALSAYAGLGPVKDGLVVFRTRLGLGLLDALGDGHPAAPHVGADLIRNGTRDGYAARDLLNHPTCLTTATRQQANQLRQVVDACALDVGTISAARLTEINTALDTAEAVITRVRDFEGKQPAPIVPAMTGRRSRATQTAFRCR